MIGLFFVQVIDLGYLVRDLFHHFVVFVGPVQIRLSPFCILGCPDTKWLLKMNLRDFGQIVNKQRPSGLRREFWRDRKQFSQWGFRIELESKDLGLEILLVRNLWQQDQEEQSQGRARLELPVCHDRSLRQLSM